MTRLRRASRLAVLLIATGCGLLDVSNPGQTPDDKLDDPGAAAGIVAGASHALSSALNYLIEMDAVVSGELTSSGSYGTFGGVDGIVTPEDENDTWSLVQQARWTAEQGVARLQQTLGESYATSAYAARANLLAGIANRFIGESFCHTVIDGGPLEDRTASFARAEQYLTDAIALSEAAGNDDYLAAAYGGRAEVRAALDRWDEAAADAAKVPTSFQYDALFSDSSSTQWNAVANETHITFLFTVHGTRWALVHDDPRVPWDTVFTSDHTVQPAADGSTPVFRQDKYPELDSPIPLVKGTALRTLEAEAALRDGNVPGAVARINDERAFYGLPPIDPEIAPDSAWALLRYERSAVTWLEGRHLWDASRWFASTDPAVHDDFLRGRSTCLPVSQAEADSNPNF